MSKPFSNTHDALSIVGFEIYPFHYFPARDNCYVDTIWEVCVCHPSDVNVKYGRKANGHIPVTSGQKWSQS